MFLNDLLWLKKNALNHVTNSMKTAIHTGGDGGREGGDGSYQNLGHYAV